MDRVEAQRARRLAKRSEVDADLLRVIFESRNGNASFFGEQEIRPIVEGASEFAVCLLFEKTKLRLAGDFPDVVAEVEVGKVPTRGSIDKAGVEPHVGSATVKRRRVDARFASAFQAVGARRDDVPNPRGDEPTSVDVLIIASGFHFAVPPNARIVTEKPEREML